MFSVQQAQTGNRVYGGTSQSPNRGQVSGAGAQGYIKRELRNKRAAGVQRRIGGDGKSDNRSSIAAQALKRMSGQGNFFIGGTHNHGGGGKAKSGGKRATGDGPGGRPIVKGDGMGKKPPFKKHGAPNTSGGLGTQTVQQPPVVKVNENGILELPYNQDFAVGQLDAINGANDQLLALKAEGDQQAQSYGQNTRDAQLAYQSLKQQTLNGNAARGTAFSSAYGTAVANNANQYANQIGDLQQQNTGFLNNQAMQRAAIQSALNQQLAALSQGYANDLNDQAGSLGYGNAKSHEGKKYTPPKSKHRNKRHHKNRGKKR